MNCSCRLHLIMNNERDPRCPVHSERKKPDAIVSFTALTPPGKSALDLDVHAEISNVMTKGLREIARYGERNGVEVDWSTIHIESVDELGTNFYRFTATGRRIADTSSKNLSN